jgi:hypothetical protein
LARDAALSDLDSHDALRRALARELCLRVILLEKQCIHVLL